MITWPGKGAGVRGPMQDETPLSQSEVDYLIDHWHELVWIFWV